MNRPSRTSGGEQSTETSMMQVPEAYTGSSWTFNEKIAKNFLFAEDQKGKHTKYTTLNDINT